MRRSALILLALVVAAAILLGYALGAVRDDGGEQADRSPEARVTPAAPRPATTPGAEPAADSASARAWRLIDQTRAAAGDDTERQSELLEQRLRGMPGRAIAAFDAARRRMDRELYTWNVWGAAYVIEDGCSDDCFRDFRSYLISLGRGPFETALRDPDALAPIVQDAETGDWENADNVAPEAYEDVTGDELPHDDEDLSGEPRGRPWDDDQAEQLVQRFPRLAARFR